MTSDGIYGGNSVMFNRMATRKATRANDIDKSSMIPHDVFIMQKQNSKSYSTLLRTERHPM